MFFTPNIKRKRGGSTKWLVKPFPNIDSAKKCEGIFIGISVEVFAHEDIATLYDNGFYGKGSHSRSTPQALQNVSSKALTNEVSESLSLGLEEAFFLAYYLEVLCIKDLEGNQIGYQKFLQDCLSINEVFVETLASYLYLKSKGWTVKSGLKFGGNFLIYRKGPRFYHATFVVIVNNPFETGFLDTKNLKGLQRIAETSDKDVLFLEVHKPSNFHLPTTESICNLEISEMIVRRFNCTSFVQTRNLTK